MTNTKAFTGVTVKNADKGEVSAVFSTFNVVDADGDVTLPGAFTDGTEVAISAYGHASWGGGTSALPVGKGIIRTTDAEAVLEGKFFMNTTAGRETFEVVKAMGELQEWSYSVHPTKHSFGEFEGRHVQFLEKLDGPREVSPVLAGAGIRTRTLAMKSRTDAPPAVKRGIPVHETETVSRSWDGPETVKALPEDARPSQLRTVYAWVDPDGDPETKSSYEFAHHHGVDGPANLRACMAGIAALNGAKGAELPEPDRKSVWDHLASHLRDADREPPVLRACGTSPVKFADELLEGLAGLSGLIDSAARVVALRAEKGKTLSNVNVELLDWIGDDMKRLDALLRHTPEGVVSDEEVASVVLQSLAALHDL